MKRFRRIFLILLVILCLVTLVLAADRVSSNTESLEGKSLLILGDSYSANHRLSSPQEGWPQQVADSFGMTLYNHAISGSTLAGGSGGSNPMVDRCRALTETDVDVIIVQGGSNDWSHLIPIGEPDSHDETTMLGALNAILDHLESTYPEATIICFTPWISTGGTNGLGLETTAYTDAMLELCRDRDILCYDASNTAQNGIYMNQESFRARYCLSSTDRWHLNPAGQALFASAFSSWLGENLLGITTADRFADMAGASWDLKIAVSLLYENGIMFGTSDTLFSPSQAATRTALAVTLYRLAGTPKSAAIALSDVSPQHNAYSAICWALEQGLMAPQDGSFLPDQILHRDELVQAMYIFFTRVSGGEVMRLSGIGHYSDRDSIPEEFRTAWGWALSENLILTSDKLGPDSIVSRGQLAMALSKLMQMH